MEFIWVIAGIIAVFSFYLLYRFFSLLGSINIYIKSVNEKLGDIYLAVNDVTNGADCFHYYTDKIIKIKKKINLFVAPDFQSDIVCSLLLGDTVELLEKKEIESAVWLNVNDNQNNKGWCFSGFNG